MISTSDQAEKLAKTIAEAAIAKFRGSARVNNNKVRHQTNGCSDDSDLDSYQNCGMRTPYHKKYKKHFNDIYHVSISFLSLFSHDVRLSVDKLFRTFGF